jgi:hypothetical protein
MAKKKTPPKRLAPELETLRESLAGAGSEFVAIPRSALAELFTVAGFPPPSAAAAVDAPSEDSAEKTES